MSERSALAPNNPYYPYILYYIPSLNRFMDHQWIVIHDLHRLFDTWQINAWVNRGEDGVMTTRNGTQMMLYYLLHEEEDEVYDYFGFQESFGMTIDRRRY